MRRAARLPLEPEPDTPDEAKLTTPPVLIHDAHAEDRFEPNAV
jgi:hypothetical protein